MKKRLQFNAQGKLVGVDGAWRKPGGVETNDGEREEVEKLKTSDSLGFLRQQDAIEPKDTSGWSLYSEGKKLAPLRFSNGKTQEDVVDEVVQRIREGHKAVFVHGVCGTGKSAIALNIARRMGRASIVVPIKTLQRQYEQDYTSHMYLIKGDGTRMKIAMITGRENHDSVFLPGVSCADPLLPDTIKITEKHYEKLREYYESNPLIKNKELPDLKKLKRIAIAPANPYWSPILRADYEPPLRDAHKKKYLGLCGKEFIFYHRKRGCSYYDQYLAYTEADAIIFNAAKYKIEMALERKPETAVDIIDECDEFLDSFSKRDEINLTRLASALPFLHPQEPEAQALLETAQELLRLEEKNKQALGIDENRIFHIQETQLERMLAALVKSAEIDEEISADDASYASHALEVGAMFEGLFSETYVTFRRDEDKNLVASLVTTNLSARFQELAGKTKALVLMSGTLHSREVLERIFGIKEFAVVAAETLQQGTIEIHRTGREIHCSYSNLNGEGGKRSEYLRALAASVEKAKRPVLVHVGAFKDLPSERERAELGLQLPSHEQLYRELQQDKTGKQVARFKAREIPILFTTKCGRGVDFPGEMCNSVVFTKYPNPNVQDVFWKVLQKTHPQQYWEFYLDKARREFLQKIYRAVRSRDDHVFVLSPDSRVLDAVRKLQIMARQV